MSRSDPRESGVVPLLESVRRRLTVRAALAASVAGLLVSALIVLYLGIAPGSEWPAARLLGVQLLVVLASVALCAAGAAALVRRRTLTALARTIESRAPESRNVILTAAEVIESGRGLHPRVDERVRLAAASTASAIDVATILPFGRHALAVAAAAATAIVAALAGAGGARAGVDLLQSIGNDGPPEIRGVEVTVVPPAYSGLEPRSLRDPPRIDAMAGSAVRFTVRASADSVAFETFEGGRVVVTRGSGGTFATEILADRPGYIVVEPLGPAGSAGTRRLVGLSVTPDVMPAVRVSAPGRDLLLADANRSIAVTVEAEDDHGLASIELRYTRVSGSGEQFTFTDGSVPLAVDRSDSRRWSGRGSLRLQDMGLEAGDMLVYRAIAADNRPGAPRAESDTYIIEIGAPGALPAGGFSADDRDDRYGVSQAMVILKTEQLIARRASLAQDSIMELAHDLAAQQRSVRAEFVFMMGGELAEEILDAAGMGDLHEEAEAEAEDDILAGRHVNQGRIDIIRAIRAMSHATVALNFGDLDRALKEEKTALDFLQRAFARSRYILRALTERERLDLSRRLSGDLSAAASDRRPSAAPDSDPRRGHLREALADIASLGGELRAGADRPALADRASRLAERVLRLGPADPELQHVAALLDDAGPLLSAGRMAEASASIESSVMSLARTIGGDMTPVGRGPPGLGLRQLRGALSDALGAAGRR